MENNKFDEIFLQIAGQAGGIEPLLDEFFGFLSRKTDFYIEYQLNEKAKMGFPPGINEKMVLRSFKKYPIRQYQEQVNNNNNSITNTTSNNTTNDNTLQSSSILPPIPPASTPSNTSITTDINTTNTNLNERIEEVSTKSTSITRRVNESGLQIPIGNGGIADKYYWTQTLKEITVYIDLDFRVKGKEVQCNITPNHLTLSVRGFNGC